MLYAIFSQTFKRLGALWFCTKLPQDVFNKLEEVNDKFSRGELTGQKRSKNSATSMPDCLLSKEGLGSYVSVTKGLIEV